MDMHWSPSPRPAAATLGAQPWTPGGWSGPSRLQPSAVDVLTFVLRCFALCSADSPSCETSDTAFFTATDSTHRGTGSGTELWKTDGTAAGTVMVKDVRTGLKKV